MLGIFDMTGVHQRIQHTIPSANEFASGLSPDPQRINWKIRSANLNY
jgi:hypothetical protein